MGENLRGGIFLTHTVDTSGYSFCRSCWKAILVSYSFFYISLYCSETGLTDGDGFSNLSRKNGDMRDFVIW